MWLLSVLSVAAALISVSYAAHDPYTRETGAAWVQRQIRAQEMAMRESDYTALVFAMDPRFSFCTIGGCDEGVPAYTDMLAGYDAVVDTIDFTVKQGTDFYRDEFLGYDQRIEMAKGTCSGTIYSRALYYFNSAGKVKGFFSIVMDVEAFQAVMADLYGPCDGSAPAAQISQVHHPDVRHPRASYPYPQPHSSDYSYLGLGLGANSLSFVAGMALGLVAICIILCAYCIGSGAQSRNKRLPFSAVATSETYTNAI